MEDWHEIDGYSKYVINKDGVVKNTKTNKELLPSYKEGIKQKNYMVNLPVSTSLNHPK
jgi:hypothetical protein